MFFFYLLYSFDLSGLWCFYCYLFFLYPVLLAAANVVIKVVHSRKIEVLFALLFFQQLQLPWVAKIEIYGINMLTYVSYRSYNRTLKSCHATRLI